MFRENPPYLRLCGSQLPYQELQQEVPNETVKKDFRKVWGCQSCLGKCDPQETKSTEIRSISNPQVLYQAMVFTNALEKILSPEKHRHKENKARETKSLEVLKMESLPLQVCPWEWKQNPLCVEILDLHSDIKINPALFIPDQMPKRLYDGYKLFLRVLKIVEGHWYSVDTKARKERADKIAAKTKNQARG